MKQPLRGIHLYFCSQEIYPSYDVTAQVLQVGDDVAVGLYVCMLDELGEVLLPDAYKENHRFKNGDGNDNTGHVNPSDCWF